MRTWRNPAAALLALAIVSAPPSSQPSQAQMAVACVNCADRVNQLLQYAREVEMVAETVTMRIAQARMLENQITNMASLPSRLAWNVEGNIVGIQQLLRRGTQLAANAGAVSSDLQSYAGYLSIPIDMPAQYGRWSQQSNDSISSTLAVLGVQQRHMGEDRALTDAIRGRSQNADGIKGALQANTEMASQQVAELHQLRALMMTDAQMRTNALAIAADREAMEAAATTQFNGSPLPSYRGGRRWGDRIQ